MRLIVPFAPGGATDILARLVGQKIHERWGQTGVVENRPGGGGNIGADFVAKAAPDGYTLLVGGVPHAIGMSLYQKLTYDLAKDLAPISNLATFPSIIAVHPQLPVKNIKELLALAKARPAQLNYGALAGSPNHLAIELLNMLGGVKMTLIPYKGGGQVVTDLVAGQVQLASVGFPPGIAMVQAGRLRAIAQTGEKRVPTLRDVPTVVESGIPGYVVTSWYGMFGPAALPRDIVAKWGGEITGILNAADVKERLATLGAEPAPVPGEEFGRFVREEIARWAKVVKASGATAN
jgi:tripartite-type tricarboxylate transporter receptor subunit TctC